MGYRLGVMTICAVIVTALQKDSCSVARAIHKGAVNDSIDQRSHQCRVPSSPECAGFPVCGRQ